MNEETLISASRDSLIKIWSASTGVQIASKKGQQEKVRDVKCRRDFHVRYLYCDFLMETEILFTRN